MENNNIKEIEINKENIENQNQPNVEVVDPNEPKSEITEQHIESFEEFDDKKMVKTINTKGDIAYKYKKHVDMTNKIVVNEEQLKNLQLQQNPKKKKSGKGAIGVLSFLAIAGIASAVTAPLIIWKNYTKTDPTRMEHKIEFQNAGSWSISGPTKAKRGDTVKFDVTKTTNAETVKIPDYLSVGSNKFALTKDENATDTWTTGNFTWEFVEEKTIALTLKNEVISDVTWDVGFDLNGGTTSEQSKLYQKVQDNGKITNPPNYTAPTNYVFDKWQISTDLGTTWTDFDINNDVITSSAIIKALWKYSDDVIHTVNFILRDDETQKSGSLTTTINNNKKWSDVVKPEFEKNSYEFDGWYYIDETGTAQTLTDDIELSFGKSITFNVFANWNEAKGTISFDLKDDKLQWVTAPAASYKVESGTLLSEIARPTIKGSKDAEKVYYPNGKWLIKDDVSGSWVDVDEDTVFNSSTNITIVPDYSEATLGSEVTTTVTFDAGEGDFGSEEKTKTYTNSQTVTAETTEFGFKWSDIKSSEPTTINAPTGWKVVEDNKWGVTLTDDTLMFGNVTLKANYTPTEKHKYYVQLFSDDEQIAWSGTQYYTKEYTGKPSDEKTLTLGDLGFIKKELNVDGTDKYSLDDSVVNPVKTDNNLSNWCYYKDGWHDFNESFTDMSSLYSSMYNMKLCDMADTDGNIKIKPKFESIYGENTIIFVSNTPNVYLEDGINVVKIPKSTNKLSEIMNTFQGRWVSDDGNSYVPVYYSNLLTGEKLYSDSVITTDIVLEVHWGGGAFTATKSLVEYWNLDAAEGISFGEEIPQCPWANSSEIDVKLICDELYDDEGGLADMDEFAQFWGYEKAEDLIGLERTVEINGKEHRVRVIGTEHDTIADGEVFAGKKAALTFEMVNVLSNSTGQKMSSRWDGEWDDEQKKYVGQNWDYRNSTLRNNLCGNDDQASWGSGTSSDKKTVFQKLPSELQLDDVIQKVKKEVAVGTKIGELTSYSVMQYNDKLFPLTYTEMGFSGDSTAAVEGSAYKFWTDHNTDSNILMKSDVSKTVRRYFLASPHLSNQTWAWYIKNTGVKGYNTTVSDYTYCAVSFAFCM